MPKLGTRRKFPAKVADLRTRWCSAYAKIDVFSALVNNQPRFHHQKILVVTGERAEESASRAKYQVFEPHRNDARSGKLQRHIDHWRPVHHLSEKEVWAKLEAWQIQPHPAYRIGFGRLSCARCIFGSPNQWATNRAIAPVQTERMEEYEREFEHTVDAKWSIGRWQREGRFIDRQQRTPNWWRWRKAGNMEVRLWSIGGKCRQERLESRTARFEQAERLPTAAVFFSGLGAAKPQEGR